MRDAAAYASQDAEKKAAVEALNAGESTMYRVNTALGSKAGKALDKESKNRIKEAERALVKQMRHKKAEKMTPEDTRNLVAAREALESVSAPLVAAWEAEQNSRKA